MKASYAAVKSDAEYQKRKTLDTALAKPVAAKRVRADENAHQRTSALIEELLERETQQLGCQQPPAAQHPHAGATDFTGLFPKAAGAGAQPQAQRAARTFEDLTSHHRQHRQVLGSLPPSGFDLPTPLAPLQGVDATNFVPASAARDRQLPPCAAAPVDWSLKTTVRFSSPTPFAVAEEAALLGGAAVVQAQRAAANADGVPGLSMQQRLLAALHSWQFPADPRPPPAAAKLRATPPDATQRRLDWQAAFASLYDALRCGACDAFYYVAPEGSKRPFAAFFGAAGVGGRPRLHALLTRSTGGVRALLDGLALGFAAPLLPGEAERRALEADQSAVPLDGSQSLLVFEGAPRVHGLFDFLLNESTRSHGDDCDVPLLLAPAQFAHATLRALAPKVLGASDAKDASRAQHRLELRCAAMPPWVVDRVAGVLAITQDGNFTMACDTHNLTLALNWCPAGSCSAGKDAAAPGGATGWPSRRQLGDFEARQRGCWDAEEAERWCTAVPGLSCNVLRELRCDGGVFTARLSAKSAEHVVA